MSNLTDRTFGSLTAIKPIRLSKDGSLVWEFRCACGNLTEWIGTSVVALSKKADNPQVPSCGCVRISRAIETNITHGYSRHPLHSTWQAMKQRCYNPKHALYALYGGKGVTICPEWLSDTYAFISWSLANGWEPGKHLDKDILSDSQNTIRTYSPTTCQFITAAENVKYSGNRSNFLHNPKIKLTPTDVLEIKQLYTVGNVDQRELANQFNVTQTTIWRAIHSTT
jgi:predicted DNA-binding protein (UPF0251 family)